MGSGCAKDELTRQAKKIRERRRRVKKQKKRLLALGIPETEMTRMDTKTIRAWLARPERTKRLWAAKK
ncbi:MAG: hypothetical protein GX806_03035 [Lentisphaerae bacterium]|nr:hypothetical protein [Lentisphaerota bacterium]